MKNIIYIAQFKDASGYANSARAYLRILDQFLDKKEYNLKIISLNFEKQNYADDNDSVLIQKYQLENIKEFIENNKYILIVHGLPHFCFIDEESFSIKKYLENKNCEKKINIVAWETDVVPQQWTDIYKKQIYDQIIVPSQWNKEVFEEQTGVKTDVVYYPIFDFDDSDKKYNSTFRIFSMSQWQHRKGFDILVKAYYQEFFDQNDVELFIKTYRNETSKSSSEEKEKAAIASDINLYKSQILHYGKLPTCKILLKTGFASKEEIIKIYNSSTIFCMPTRGEAFGMTIAQASMSGLPCIVPDLGGHLDFLDRNNNYFISSRFEPLYNIPFYVYSSKDMNIIESSLLSTRQQLRKAYNDWKSGKLVERSLETKKYTKQILNTKNIFDSFINLI